LVTDLSDRQAALGALLRLSTLDRLSLLTRLTLFDRLLLGCGGLAFPLAIAK
jgi:hypothetical protein